MGKRHHNPRMQKAWNKHQAWQFDVLELCDERVRFDVEQRYLDELFNEPMCMNCTPHAEFLPGYSHTPETRSRISETHVGMVHTEETKARMRKPKSPEHAAKCRENGRKAAGSKTNSTGYVGVSKGRWGRYRASLRSNGKYIHVGVFDTADAAAAAYQRVKSLSLETATAT